MTSYFIEPGDWEGATGESLPPGAAGIAVVTFDAVRRAIEPVATWFDLDGEEGRPFSLLEAVSETAKMLVDERADYLRVTQALRKLLVELDAAYGSNAESHAVNAAVIARAALRPEVRAPTSPSPRGDPLVRRDTVMQSPYREVAFGNKFIAYPSHWPPYINGTGRPCTLLQGPCSCGAWHDLNEWVMVSPTPIKDTPARPTGTVTVSADLEAVAAQLGRLLAAGCKIAKQDGEWWLFERDGEGVVGGATYLEMSIRSLQADADAIVQRDEVWRRQQNYGNELE